jgi:hypothetical protein
MTESREVCGNCCFKSDGINTQDPDYCYCIDATVVRSTPGCAEWRGSLRDEPLEPPAAADKVPNA